VAPSASCCRERAHSASRSATVAGWCTDRQPALAHRESAARLHQTHRCVRKLDGTGGRSGRGWRGGCSGRRRDGVARKLGARQTGRADTQGARTLAIATSSSRTSGSAGSISAARRCHPVSDRCRYRRTPAARTASPSAAWICPMAWRAVARRTSDLAWPGLQASACSAHRVSAWWQAAVATHLRAQSHALLGPVQLQTALRRVAAQHGLSVQGRCDLARTAVGHRCCCCCCCCCWGFALLLTSSELLL
jgi:hypothetical protein